MKTLKLAVIGKDVSKSVSPEIHSFIATELKKRVEYGKISIPEEQFEEKIGEILSEYDGLNVTIPYKLKVIPYLKKIEGDAAVFGAVNTVNCNTLSGNNTDGLGFDLMLKNNQVAVSGKTVLVLGAGGAGRSVVKKLQDGGATVTVYDKNLPNAKSVADEFEGVKYVENIPLTPYYAVVNATGVGMHRTEGISPVGEELISLCEVAVDLIYTPPKSKFLQIAEKSGKKIINGLAMLFYQAYFAECVFWDIEPDFNQAKKLFEKFENSDILRGQP